MRRSLLDMESSSETLRFLFFTKTLLEGGVFTIAFSEVRANNFNVSVCGICEQLGQIRCAIMNRAPIMLTRSKPSKLQSAAPDLDAIRAAYRRIAPRIHRTPVVTSSSLDEIAGARLFFKCENLQ